MVSQKISIPKLTAFSHATSINIQGHHKKNARSKSVNCR